MKSSVTISNGMSSEAKMSKQVIRNLCSEENHFKAKINGINVVTTVVIDSKKEERSRIYLNFSRKKPSMKEST